MTAQDGTLGPEVIENFRSSFEANPMYRVAMNAATQGQLEEIALSRRVVDGLDWGFSHEVHTGGITAQKFAGTCWIYAGLNWLRKRTIEKMNVEEFYFSQNYLVFFDKLEKANRFFERMIELRDLPLDDRRVHHYLQSPVSDGGDWLLLSDLIRKYGVVPREAMHETTNLANSGFKNKVLSLKLRQGAAQLRNLAAEGAGLEDLRAKKLELLNVVYRMLSVLLGEPPKTFDLSFRDKDKKFHRTLGLTPQDFFRDWVELDLDDQYHLMCSPLPDTPYNQVYAVENLRNVEGRPQGLSLNLPIETIRELSQKLLEAGKAVFFDCDVTQGLHRPLGILDPDLYEYDLLFDTSFDWDRSERMQYFHQRPTHCMVMTGVDLVEGKPRKWKIENSWGDALGHKGNFQMSDAWFEEHVYGITVSGADLGEELRAHFAKQPVVLPPWHTLS